MASSHQNRPPSEDLVEFSFEAAPEAQSKQWTT